MTVDEPVDDFSDEEEEHIIRMKWCADGSNTLDDVIEKLRAQIRYIEHLKEEGYELTSTMDDDYGYIRKKTDSIVVEEID